MNNKNKSPEELALFSTAETLRTFCNHTRLIMGLEDPKIFAQAELEKDSSSIMHRLVRRLRSKLIPNLVV